jgi:hypothetical protein
MDLIRTSCWIQKPVGGYYVECLEILGLSAKTWIYLLVWALVLGFGAGYLLLKYKNIEFKSKKSVLVFAISFLAVLLLLYILILFYQRISQIGVYY